MTPLRLRSNKQFAEALRGCSLHSYGLRPVICWVPSVEYSQREGKGSKTVHKHHCGVEFGKPGTKIDKTYFHFDRNGKPRTPNFGSGAFFFGESPLVKAL
jgi:hypothetical protein